MLTAFFLEATFLGILLFGRGRVGKKFFFFAALMVAIGTLTSAFWILAANSWMQTPVGYEIRDGLFYPVDWWAIVFNPSFPYRFAHMVTACFLTTGFVVIAVSAWYLLKGRCQDTARAGLSMTLWLVLLLAPLQVFIGDLHGLNTLKHQLAKVAAMEANWETQRRMPLILFAIPDPKNERNRLEITIPALGSLILTHALDGEVKGLKDWAPKDRPAVIMPFFGFRVMVGIGLLMVFVAGAGLLLRLRGKLYGARWFLRLCSAMLPAGFIAVLAGWFVTETGRQPWVVYGVMRTVDGASPSVAWGSVLTSLVLFVVVYGFIFGAGVYYIAKLIKRGPDASAGPAGGMPARPSGGTPSRPMSGADAAAQEA